MKTIFKRPYFVIAQNSDLLNIEKQVREWAIEKKFPHGLLGFTPHPEEAVQMVKRVHDAESKCIVITGLIFEKNPHGGDFICQKVKEVDSKFPVYLTSSRASNSVGG